MEEIKFYLVIGGKCYCHGRYECKKYLSIYGVFDHVTTYYKFQSVIDTTRSAAQQYAHLLNEEEYHYMKSIHDYVELTYKQ